MILQARQRTDLINQYAIPCMSNDSYYLITEWHDVISENEDECFYTLNINGRHLEFMSADLDFIHRGDINDD